jgi:hypothetical protein
VERVFRFAGWRAGQTAAAEAVTCFPLVAYAEMEGSSLFSVEPPMPLGIPLRMKTGIFGVMGGKASPTARSHLRSPTGDSP